MTRKPPAGLVGDNTPGVVTRNDSVTRNVLATSTPAADAPGCQHRATMSSAAAAEDQLVESEQTMAVNLIALYKAPGGDWEVGAPAPDAPTSAGGRALSRWWRFLHRRREAVDQNTALFTGVSIWGRPGRLSSERTRRSIRDPSPADRETRAPLVREALAIGTRQNLQRVQETRRSQ